MWVLGASDRETTQQKNKDNPPSIESFAPSRSSLDLDRYPLITIKAINKRNVCEIDKSQVNHHEMSFGRT